MANLSCRHERRLTRFGMICSGLDDRAEEGRKIPTRAKRRLEWATLPQLAAARQFFHVVHGGVGALGDLDGRFAGLPLGHAD